MPAACPSCGNPFTIPAGTFTLASAGATMRCNLAKCRAIFTAYKLPKAKEVKYLNADNKPVPTWVGPPLYPDLVAGKDGTVGA